ncbi:MAG TPA: aminotransferase class V-fold PLP-dependent enzyme [Bacteroidales bacterium]|nr:aminotransferase class V-fold PLP-dependent enzyme [Bacteroidales bacterium]HSA44326.1 aminotransferase class V-fold PLP-dependent enzyme [Bacteroidales bacterium]
MDHFFSRINAALQTYSNVHRGSGFHSQVSTRLYEHARKVVLEEMKLEGATHLVIFCTPRRAGMLADTLRAGTYRLLSDRDYGLRLGVSVLAVEKKALPRGKPFETGGGTTRLNGGDWVVWAGAPERFEAGTPAVMNVITFCAYLAELRTNDTFGKSLTKVNPLSPEQILYEDTTMANGGKALLQELRDSMIGRRMDVPVLQGRMPYVNFDHAASTPCLAPVRDTFLNALFLPENQRQEVVEEARKICSRILEAPLEAYDIHFFSNTTESVNVAAAHFTHDAGGDIVPVVLASLSEHSSNDLPWREMTGGEVLRIGIDAEGFLDLGQLEALLSAYNAEKLHGKKRIVLAALCGASNVTGAYNDLAGISRIVHRYGAGLLVDAAQMVAHRPVAMKTAGIDALVFSAHKVYAPFGAGVLAVRRGMLRSGGESRKAALASGEENTAGIAALGKALLLLERTGFDVIRQEEQKLTAKALNGLSEIPGVSVYGLRRPDAESFSAKGGVIPFSMKGLMAPKLAAELAARGGIGIRAGCFCAHILVKHLYGLSPRLERFQRFIVKTLPRLSLPGMARISFGITNTEAEVTHFLQVMAGIACRKKSGSLKGYRTQVQEAIRKRVEMVFGTGG